MNQHIHIITLGVKDLEASKKFYADTLGWKISNPQEGIAFFQAGRRGDGRAGRGGAACPDARAEAVPRAV